MPFRESAVRTTVKQGQKDISAPMRHGRRRHSRGPARGRSLATVSLSAIIHVHEFSCVVRPAHGRPTNGDRPAGGDGERGD